MNTLKLALITSFIALLSACGDSNEKSSMSDAAENAASSMETMTDEAREEARKRAEELEDLENQ